MQVICAFFQVLAVVLQLDEKKDVRSLFHSRSQLLLGHDTTDGVCEDPNAVCIDLEDTGLQTVSEENIETQVDILGARQAAIQQRMSQKSSTVSLLTFCAPKPDYSNCFFLTGTTFHIVVCGLNICASYEEYKHIIVAGMGVVL